MNRNKILVITLYTITSLFMILGIFFMLMIISFMLSFDYTINPKLFIIILSIMTAVMYVGLMKMIDKVVLKSLQGLFLCDRKQFRYQTSSCTKMYKEFLVMLGHSLFLIQLIYQVIEKASWTSYCDNQPFLFSSFYLYHRCKRMNQITIFKM